MFLTVVYTLISYVLLILILIIFSVGGFIFLLLPERYRFGSDIFYWWLNLAYRACLESTFLNITVRGRENIPSKPSIFVANHQSALDIPLLGSLVNGRPHIWMAWSGLYKRFILGLFVRQLSVPINASSLKTAVVSLRKAVLALQKYHAHGMIFPEGQRFTDGNVHKFFGGFVTLARKTGRNVVPVRIFNVEKAYPPGSFLAYRYPIQVVVGETMSIKDGESDAEFKARVYQWFCEQTEE